MADPGRNGQWIVGALERFEGPLCRYARHVVGDADTARDVVQDTFLRAVRNPPPDEVTHDANPGRLRAWLFTVCRRRALDVRRKDRPMTTAAPDTFNLHPSPHASPYACVEANDSAHHALAALASLPENQRECLRLKFAAGLTYAEIAAVTGLSASNVGYLIHHGLKTLRTQLDDEQPRTPPDAPADRLR